VPKRCFYRGSVIRAVKLLIHHGRFRPFNKDSAIKDAWKTSSSLSKKRFKLLILRILQQYC